MENNCSECAKAQNCPDTYIHLDPKDRMLYDSYWGSPLDSGDRHCKCGNVTTGWLAYFVDKYDSFERNLLRIPHIKICTDHLMAYEEDMFETEGELRQPEKP